jgi:anaerobic C4-dicarboxylate transporter
MTFFEHLLQFANVLISLLFLAKLLWNAATPIAVRIETQKLPIEDRDRAKKRRVSMATIVEIILLLALVLISAVTGRGIFHLSAFRLFIAGVGAIVLSYGCCALVGRIVRRI